jgi:predicted nicotinamide N-methyase
VLSHDVAVKRPTSHIYIYYMSATQAQRAAVVLVIASAAAVWLLLRRRRSKTKRPTAKESDTPPIQEMLAIAEASLPFCDSSPIYNSLNRGGSHTSDFLRLEYHKPDEFEPLDVRLFQRDVAKGCMDVDVLGTDAGRDWVTVAVRYLGSDDWRELRLPIFLAHLSSPAALFDPELDEQIVAPLYHDGTFTGSLLWDSAIHVSELLLSSSAWHERIRGASVVELGCGLALPGWVSHLLGARAALLTDRAAISDLVEHGRMCNGAPENVATVEFPWSDEGAQTLLAHSLLDGSHPDVLIACDCIFMPLFGGPFLLLQMLLLLAGPHTHILIGLERRPDDGAESFFQEAAAAGFTTQVCFQRGRVVVCEMSPPMRTAHG